jgi:hypothetical protein
MRRFAALVLVLVLWGCSSTRTVTVDVPPRMELKPYATIGVVEFASNYLAATNSRATREFQARIHSAQPGTRLLELGPRQALLAAAGLRQLDVEALRRIGEKAGVDAIFVGDIVYSDPKTEVKINDLSRLDGSARTEVRGDMSLKLVETRSGATVWSGTSWARREVSRYRVSAQQGVSAASRDGDPRDEMVPTLLMHATQDFRPTTARQRVPK